MKSMYLYYASCMRFLISHTETTVMRTKANI